MGIYLMGVTLVGQGMGEREGVHVCKGIQPLPTWWKVR